LIVAVVAFAFFRRITRGQPTGSQAPEGQKGGNFPIV